MVCELDVRILGRYNHFDERGIYRFWAPFDGGLSTLPKEFSMIRKLKSGQYRLYSRKKDESTGKRRNLGTFSTLEQAKQHEREVQYFKRH